MPFLIKDLPLPVAGWPRSMGSKFARGLVDWQQQNRFQIYPHWRHRYAPGITHNTEHVFGVQVPRALEITLAPREHLDYAWLPWSEAAERVFSWSNAEAIRALPQRISAMKSGT